MRIFDGIAVVKSAPKQLALLWSLVLCILTFPAFAQMPLDASPDAKVSAPQDSVRPSPPDEKARSEIIYRAGLGRADDVKMLLDQGGSVNQITGDGVSLLSLAAARRDPEGINVVKLLIGSGADINARDKKGQTPLFSAARVGNIDIVNFLLEHNADSSALDNDGNAARAVAFIAGHKDVMQVIDDFVAKPKAPKPTEVQQTTDPNKATQPPVTPLLDPNQSESIIPVQPLKPDPTPDLDAKVAEMKKSATSVEEMKRIQAELAEENKRSMMEDGQEHASGVTPRNATSEAENIAKEAAKEEKAQKEIESLNNDLAFNSCGFQYWSFCSDVKQNTELQPEELSIAMLSYKNKADELRNKLVKQYKVPVDDTTTIVTSSQQRVFNELTALGTNRNRHEKGVGKMEDIIKRCQNIGRLWQLPLPGTQKNSPPDKKNNTGKSQSGSNDSDSGSGGAVTASSGSKVSSGGGSASGGGGGLTTGNDNKSQSGQPPLQEVPVNNLFK